MKTVRVLEHCLTCGWSVEYDLNTNEHGFFVIPEARCPNDLFTLNQEIIGPPIDINET